VFVNISSFAKCAADPSSVKYSRSQLLQDNRDPEGCNPTDM
jgi:hypothetical protein